jgi:hypothetical protein
MLFESPDGNMMVRFNTVGFVDNSTCITGGNKDDTLQELIQKMKEDAQLWHNLLWCLGDRLELPKYGYHLVYFDFKDSGIPEMRHSPSESITLHNELGDEVEIESKNIYQTGINLGHAKCPKSTGITQLKRSTKTAVCTSDAIVKCGCSRTETRMLYQTVWKPSIEYNTLLPSHF